jgi:hypothetical protein
MERSFSIGIHQAVGEDARSYVAEQFRSFLEGHGVV